MCNKLMLSILIFTIQISAECIDYKKLNTVFNKIDIGMSEVNLKKIMKNYGWELYSGGLDGLFLKNYSKIVNENGDTIIAAAPIGKERLQYKRPAMVDVAMIVVDIDKKDKVVVNKIIMKNLISSQQYKKIYGENPKLLIDTLQEQSLCKGRNVKTIEDDSVRTFLRIDSLLKKSKIKIF